MHHQPPHIGRLVAVCVAIIIWVLLLSYAVESRAQSYTVGCGEDVHASISRAGNPQTVTFEPNCVYRLARRIDPANGQTFEGNGATLNGSKLLPDALWQKRGAYWYAAGQTQEGTRKSVFGETMCESGSPRCNFPENLYRNGLPLKHGAALGEGEWFFDYQANEIIVYTDPIGRVMETSNTIFGQTNCAICGAARGVTIENFRVEKFGTTTENAALEAFYINATLDGRDWTIINNVIQYNGAVGAVVRAGGKLLNNKLLSNGQSGYGAGGTISVKAAGVRIEDNEVAWNNFKRVNPHFSSGGGKASWTVGLEYRGNYVHHNYKRGTWFDLDNSESIIEKNTFERNDTALFLEMGGSATVRNNMFTCNGSGSDGTFQTSILVTNASGILIEDNDITVCATGNGIGIREDGNPTRTISGTRRETTNIDIRGNRITFLACAGAVGQDGYGGGVLGRVTWADNSYTTKCADYPHWLNEGVKLSFSEWLKRYPSEVLVSGEPIPEPTAVSTATATATLQPVPATMTATQVKPSATPELTPVVTPLRLLIKFGGEIWIEVQP